MPKTFLSIKLPTGVLKLYYLNTAESSCDYANKYVISNKIIDEFPVIFLLSLRKLYWSPIAIQAKLYSSNFLYTENEG